MNIVMKKWILWGGLVLVLLMIFSIVIEQYNSLVKLDESVKTQWGQVESVYQRRADLIPNIVATVKKEANFEQETLKQVVEARASATQLNVRADNAQDFAKFQATQWELSKALGKLLMLTENYPTLQSNKAFSDLRVQLEGAENRIAVERMNYNTAVQAYNTEMRSFPISLVAKSFWFEKANLFEANKGAEVAPVVEF